MRDLALYKQLFVVGLGVVRMGGHHGGRVVQNLTNFMGIYDTSEVTNFDNMTESATLMTGGSVLLSGKGDSWSIKNAGCTKCYFQEYSPSS